MTNMETDLPYLEQDKDCHGNPRIYVRRNGKRVPIREQEGTLEFAKSYADALEKLCRKLPAKAAPPLTTHPKGTLGYMGAKYFASKEFEKIAKKSQQARRSCLEEWCKLGPFYMDFSHRPFQLVWTETSTYQASLVAKW